MTREGNLDYMTREKYFQEFFNAFPVRESYEPAYLEYLRLIKHGIVDHDTLVDAAKRYALLKNKYKVQPARWLKEKRWKDDLPRLPQDTNQFEKDKRIVWQAVHQGYLTTDQMMRLKKRCDLDGATWLKKYLIDLAKGNIDKAKNYWDNHFKYFLEDK